MSGLVKGHSFGAECSKFRWIHLSDFHFTATDPYDRNTVLKPLLAEIKRRRTEGFQADALFVTGDIAYSGLAAEYRQATAFFEALRQATGLDKEQLFVVPGNHDLDKEAGTGLQRTLDSEKESVGYFAAGKPKYHFHKFQAFRVWFDRYFSGIRTCPQDTTCHEPEILVTANGLRIAVLPLNTALFSLPDGQDHNKLWIGRRNLDGVLEKLATMPSALTVALMHHPLDWLNDAEGTVVETLLQERVDIILRGHLHENKVRSIAATHDGFVCLAAGACYQTRQYPNTALLCCVDIGSRTLEVTPIRYADTPRPLWTSDSSLFHPKAVGCFSLPGNQPTILNHLPKEEATFMDRTGNAVTDKASVDSELLETAQKLIVAILEKSDAATKRLAARFNLEEGKIEPCRAQVAEKALHTPLDSLFDIALDEQQALFRMGDEAGCKVIAHFVQAVLPTRHSVPDSFKVRDQNLGSANGPIELLASHKTIAEIIIAGADRRPTLFPLGGEEIFPGGEGLVAQLEKMPEGGRDPKGEQFERDVTEELAEKFESRFERDWRALTGRNFPSSLDALAEYRSEQDKNWLRGKINTIVEKTAKQKARSLGHPGCGFTYYFLVNTPCDMKPEERDRQDAILQRLKWQFSGIAFLRLAPLDDGNRDDLDAYYNLHFLLNPNQEPR